MFQKFTDIPFKEIAPGFVCKLIHTQNNTINFLEIKEGSLLPMHSHPHEQSSFVLEGEFEMTVGEETKVLTENDFVVIPCHVPHCGRAITHCRLLDVFSPVREDYR